MDRLAEIYEKNDVLFFHVTSPDNNDENKSITNRKFLYYSGDDVYRDLFRRRSKSLVIIDRDGRLAHYQGYQSTISVKRILNSLLTEDDEAR